jgi:hypothetical protein
MWRSERDVKTLTLAEIQPDWDAIFEQLKMRASIVVESDAGEASSACSRATWA